MDVLEQLKSQAEQIAAKLGLFFVQIHLNRHKATMQIKVVVDKAGGVLLDDCARVNKGLRSYIEEHDLLNNDFTIEVSSPGIDRKFSSIDDFKRCIGRKIKVHAVNSDNNNFRACGTIIDAEAQKIKLLLDNEQEITIKLDDIKKAKLEIGWKK